MQRWLGDGGMPLLNALGLSFVSYGVDDGTGWAEATWRPAELTSNPQGLVQGGVHGVVLDAAMNFAINAALEPPDRTRVSLEMKVETMRPARAGDDLTVRGEVVRLARQVAYAEARVRDAGDQLLSRATATFLLDRRA